MGKPTLWLALLSTIAFGLASAMDDYQPQQVHLSIGENNADIMVTWVTPSFINSSVVEYGTSNLALSATGNATLFTDGGSLKRQMWMHRVRLTNLTPDTRYFYHCGSDVGWSEVFTFKTWPAGNDWVLRTAMYGDLGVVNGKSLGRLQQDITKGMYDVIIHVGDFAYNFETEDAQVGDEFMRNIEPIAGYVPYMTCPGNHEEAYNFSNYKARFTMPNYEVTENMFYSWNAGPVHFIAVNTEAYYYLQYGIEPLYYMWQWLYNDLTEANKTENRSEHPWIILYGHRPMYCSTRDGDDCTHPLCRTRVGIDDNFAMERLLNDFGVDLVVWAHEHTYERLFPVYDIKVLNGSEQAPYTNPKGPVHFISGSAGCQEDTDRFIPDPPEWSAFRSSDYGYARLTVYNVTHLYWEQVSDDKDGAVIDSAWLIKDSHAPYSELYPELYPELHAH
ncbi:acid phosphatase type 7-like [Palaemon carinicauda]|uniref:acid phosphatase type 7-like n=1 Tax=Palaemon carinicauda TaxID=392227 RepID=UPI0035B68E32